MGDLCKEINELGKAIGNPARYRILEALSQGPKMVSQLAKTSRISQPAISQHLKVLKSCNLVFDRKDGAAVLYNINSGHMLNLFNKLGTTLEKPNKKSK